MAICTQENAAVQSTGLGVNPAASAFQLRMDNIWFCKVLLLFTIDTKTDARMNTHKYAYVSVMEYKGHRRPGHILHILHIAYICHILHVMHIL